MRPVLTLLLSMTAAAVAAWMLPISYVADAAQPLSIAVSIMVAAVFVRLNRGMPTLDWKSLSPLERPRLTGAVISLTREYIAIVFVNAVLLATLIVLSGIKAASKLDALVGLPGKVLAGWTALLLVLAIVRMGYVLWRDLDVVMLQKVLIDSAATREQVAAQVEQAEAKVARMQDANLRPSAPTEVREWTM